MTCAVEFFLNYLHRVVPQKLSIDYGCEDRKQVGELTGAIGAMK
jgi:hypothetical protein